jgi:plasmid stability protein
MPTLYVENVPEDLYEALRTRAKKKRSSIAAEVVELIQRSIPTKTELARRKAAFQRLAALRAQGSARPGPFPSTEEMLREDRKR